MIQAMLLSIVLLFPSQTDVIELVGGSVLRGTIEHNDALGVLLRTKSGDQVYLSQTDILRVDKDDHNPSEPEFIRFYEGKEKGDALQSAIAVYIHPKTKQIVSLVGAVHVGDPEYYHRLQEILDTHEITLWEGVTGSAEPSAEASQRFDYVSTMQLQMGRMLDLSFQKDEINYDRENFKNADMNIDDVRIELDKRNQPLLPMEGVLQQLAPGMSKSMESGSDVLERTGNKQRVSAEMKRSLGRVLGNAQQLIAQIGMHDPEKRDDVLISLRNDAAFVAVDEALEEGKKTIAVFYGAAHLPDMHRILVKEKGFHKEAHIWINAWDISPSPKYKKTW